MQEKWVKSTRVERPALDDLGAPRLQRLVLIATNKKSPGNALRFVAVAGAFRIRIGINERLLKNSEKIRTKEKPLSGGNALEAVNHKRCYVRYFTRSCAGFKVARYEKR